MDPRPQWTPMADPNGVAVTTTADQAKHFVTRDCRGFFLIHRFTRGRHFTGVGVHDERHLILIQPSEEACLYVRRTLGCTTEFFRSIKSAIEETLSSLCFLRFLLLGVRHQSQATLQQQAN